MQMKLQSLQQSLLHSLPRLGIALGAFSALIAPASLNAQTVNTSPTAGILDHPNQRFLLHGAKIICEPGNIIEQGSILIENGRILQIGPQLPADPTARAIDLKGKFIYPGFIDAGIEAELPEWKNDQGTGHWNPEITPERSVATSANTLANTNKLRQAGITAALFAPKDGILKGTSAIALTENAPLASTLLKADAALHIRLTTSRRGGREAYPSSPMGAVALARQTFLDADWYQAAMRAYQASKSTPNPETNSALATLQTHIVSGKPFIFDALNEQYALRADDFAREFGLNAILKGSGQEYQLLDPIARTQRKWILPVQFPKPPNVATAEAVLDAELEELMHWELAPENPARLDRAGVVFSLTSQGLSEPTELIPQVRKAIARGLSPDKALAALTTVPSQMLGVEDQLGRIRPGLLANFVITDGDLWSDKTKIEEVWIRGNRPDAAYKESFGIDGMWDITAIETRTATPDAKPWLNTFQINVKDSAKKIAATVLLPTPPVAAAPPVQPQPAAEGAKPEESKPNESKPNNEIKLTELRWTDRALNAKLPTKLLRENSEGTALISLSWVKNDSGAESLIGSILYPDGTEQRVRAQRTATPTPPTPTPPTNSPESEAKADIANADKANSDKPTPEKSPSDKPTKPVLSTLRYPFASFGRETPPAQPEVLLIQNTILWTCGQSGILRDADMIVRQGKIEAIGVDLPVPPNAVIIDGSKYQVSPGLIDCHSHMATDSGVNEGTQAVTAEVRIGDFINAEDVTMYRQLAGGLTSSNILHGSANPIGGQNQVIKLRWGKPYEALKFQGAPAGIKFALGENVKQSNWSESPRTRYPQSRMGVEELIRDRLNAAREYDQEWKSWSIRPQGTPPRRDLELEAIAEIIRGERWIHCHSYRQDEILALIKLCDEFHITIGSLQHILEGYKVADAMAKHGATASTFSDWWAYKFEVIDAIPYNAALMHQQKIIVSLNSDDAELGRHMNHEAAKAVKYGGVDPASALQFVTLNPAKQLRIDKYVGSLEVGKDADFVLWSGSPLSVQSRCEQTWIDGCKYFDRDEDNQVRSRDAALHRNLVQKILSSGEGSAEKSSLADDPSRLWPNHDEYCHHSHDEGHEHAHEMHAEHALKNQSNN